MPYIPSLYNDFNYNQGNYNTRYQSSGTSESDPGQDLVRSDKISFPFRFTESSNLELDDNNVAIKNELKVLIFVKNRGIPLYPIGVGLEESIFDPNDVVTQAYLSFRIFDEISKYISSIKINENNIQFTMNDSEMSILIPYVDNKSPEESLSIMSIPISS